MSSPYNVWRQKSVKYNNINGSLCPHPVEVVDANFTLHFAPDGPYTHLSYLPGSHKELAFFTRFNTCTTGSSDFSKDRNSKTLETVRPYSIPCLQLHIYRIPLVVT